MHIVTGMHRSGTSLLALWLRAAGLPMADDESFYEADEHNAKGYLEEREVIDINSRLLTGAARTAGSLARVVGQVRYLVNPQPSSLDRRADSIAGELQTVTAARSGVLVKDPRFCVTAPVWQRITGDVERCVVAVRHPAAIVDSLQRRQRIPAPLAYRFWLAHMQAILKFEPATTVFVDMDAAMAGDAAAVSVRLARCFEGGPTQQDLERAFGEVYSSTLIRSAPATSLPSSVQSVWSELQIRCASTA